MGRAALEETWSMGQKDHSVKVWCDVLEPWLRAPSRVGLRTKGLEDEGLHLLGY